MKENEKKYNDTIAAVSTPVGEGGIAVVRISGSNALSVARELVSVKAGEIEPNKMYLGRLRCGEITDEVLTVYFKAPHSYTGEDTVEIHCHGNMLIADAIVVECIRLGARAAENGEFTRRAFLNGKIDLTKAEGIIDVINARSEAELRAFAGAASGELYKKIERLQNRIKTLLGDAAAAVDYPEEDIEEITREKLKSEIARILKDVKELENTYRYTRVIRSGIKVTLLGKPNAGKSMLLNALCGSDRAIVTEIEGTTRDTVTEEYIYKGVRFLVTDTAGIRETDEQIEMLGIKRSENAAKEADVIVAVQDGGNDADWDVLKDRTVIYVRNKSDLIESETDRGGDRLFVSAKNGENIDRLKDEIYNRVLGKEARGGTVIANQRQYGAVKEAAEILKRAEKNADKVPIDFIISELHLLYRTLGRITGEISTKEICDEIFSRFCVGK